MKQRKYIRLVVLLHEDDKPLLKQLKESAKKYRVSVSALASYAMQAGLPFVQSHFEKLSAGQELEDPKK